MGTQTINITWKKPVLTGIAVLLTGFFAGQVVVSKGALAAPITSNTALAISEDEWLLREQLITMRASDDPAGLGREFTATTSVSVAGYGLTPKLALFGVVPLAHKQLKTPAGKRKASGLGDMALFARYTLLQSDGVGQTFRMAPFAGVELPTGKHNERDALGLLPTPVQLGSGSWDPFAGFIMTYATTGWQIDTSVSYQDNRRAGSVERGNVFKADASLQVRLWPDELTANTDSFLFGVLEANLVQEGKNELNGIKDPNSGGTTLFVAPGLQYAAKSWIAEASVQFPIVQNLGGTRLQKDYIARASVRFNF